MRRSAGLVLTIGDATFRSANGCSFLRVASATDQHTSQLFFNAVVFGAVNEWVHADVQVNTVA